MLKKYLIFIGLIALLIFLSGCTNPEKTAVSTVEITIDSYGDITNYDATITMSANTYDQLKSYASSKGYTSVREYFLRDFKGSDAYFKYNEPESGNSKTITFSNIVKIDPDHIMKPISIRIADNRIYFNDTTFSGEYFIPKKFIQELHYSVTSPVKIDNSDANRHSKDDFTAYWEYKNDQTIPEQYFITHVADANNIKSPGFDTIVSILVICFVILVYSKKS